MITSIASIIMAMLRQAAPVMIVAIGGMFAETSGVVNIGLEGMMLFGAFSAALVAYFTKSWVLGIIGGLLGGAIIATIHAIISIRYRGNQVVSGVAINLFASGFTVFMLRIIFNQSSNTPAGPSAPSINGTSIITFIIYIVVILASLFLYKTVTGLRIRSVGEYPLAADTVGINVYKIRYIGVITSGALAGLGGTYLSLGALNQFSKEMTAGRGFMALAALVFGKWKPKGVIVASLLFGLADALQVRMQQYFPNVPPQFIQMLPYILTLLALAGIVGKAIAPKALGKPYDKSEL
ncbi:MAG: ABC transporter permease [Fusobacteriaceae bacterium]